MDQIPTISKEEFKALISNAPLGEDGVRTLSRSTLESFIAGKQKMAGIDTEMAGFRQDNLLGTDNNVDSSAVFSSLMNGATKAGGAALPAGGKAIDYLKNNRFDPLSSLSNAGISAGQAIAEDPRKASATALRLGGTAIGGGLGAMAGPLAPVTSPLGAAEGNMLGGKFAQWLGLEDETNFKQDVETFGGDVALDAAMVVPGAVAGAGRDVFRKGIPDAEIQAAQTALQDGASATYHGYPGRRTGTEHQLFDDLSEGQSTFVEANPVAGIKPNPARPFDAVNEYQTKLRGVIDEARSTRDGITSQLDELATESDINGISFEDLDLTLLQTKMAKKDSSFGADGMATMQANVQKLKDNFNVTTPRYEGAIGVGMEGITDTVPKRLSMQEAKNVLDTVYDELREMKAFDAKSKAGGVENPSVLAKNKADIESLTAIAATLKNGINRQASKITTELGLPPEIAGQIQKANDVMHNILPFEQAAERFQTETMAGLATRDPSSLVQTDLTAPNSTTGLVMTGINAAGGEARRVAKVQARGNKLVTDLQNMIAYQTGKPQPLPRNFNALLADPTAAGTVAMLATQMGRLNDPAQFNGLPDPMKKEIFIEVASAQAAMFEETPMGFNSFVDGKLTDDIERQLYKKEVERSGIGVGEKAKIISALNRDGTFIAMGETTTKPRAVPKQTPNLTDVSGMLGNVMTPMNQGSSEVETYMQNMKEVQY